MEGFTITDSELFEFIKFDEEEYANELIQEDPDAYDENLDVCVENAMSVAHERYLEMKDAIEDNIICFFSICHRRSHMDPWGCACVAEPILYHELISSMLVTI